LTIAGNDDTTIGTIDDCASINVDDTLTFDLIVKGIDNADRIGGYQVDIDYDPAIISVTGVIDADAAGSTTPNDVTIVSRISSVGGIGFLHNSDWFSVANSMTLSAIDATISPAYPGMHESGDGVLARVTVTAIGAGITNLDIGGTIGGSDGFLDTIINGGTAAWSGQPVPVTTVQDGKIAVGQSCPA
jgi:hypothetical protein